MPSMSPPWWAALGGDVEHPEHLPAWPEQRAGAATSCAGREVLVSRPSTCTSLCSASAVPMALVHVQRLDLQVSREGDDFIVTLPSYRFDVEIEEHLIRRDRPHPRLRQHPSHAPRAARSPRRRAPRRSAT